jgi:CysZ protein
MITNLISSLPQSFKYLFKDKVNFIFMLIPVLIGSIIYYYSFTHLYDFITNYTQTLFLKHISSETLGTALYWLVKGILVIMGFFIINWTFVLIVSLIASPFNDLISERVEKAYLNSKLPSLGESFSNMLSKIVFTILNETKKILFIGVLSLFSLILSYIPILTPFAVVITFILISTQFVDYVWSRHDLAFKACAKDMMKNAIPYGISGGLFFILINIPFVNLFTPAWATSYMTLFWVKRNS